MRIAIVNVMAPYIYGGAEFMADSLRDHFIEHGHKAEVVKFHYAWEPIDNILDGMFAARNLFIDNVDRVIALKFPAYLVPFPDKKLWLVHQFRQAYDLDNTVYGCFSPSEHDQAIKQAIINYDNHYLKGLEGNIFTNSKVVSNRLMRYNNIASEPLYPPLMDAELYSFGTYSDYIFYPSRVNQTKRQHLAVEAMKYVRTNVRLIIAGKGDCKQDELFLKDMIEKNQLSDRVIYINRFISQKEKSSLFKDSLGCIYIPYDEDSYGYVTLEAFQSGKCVISCTDAGGTDLLVKSGETGYMVEPDPKAIAEAMDALYINKQVARDMGMNGLPLLKQLGITWDNVIKRFTE